MFHVLVSLADHERHGDAIIKELSERSRGRSDMTRLGLRQGLAIALAGIAAGCLVAVYLPVRRAARVDPVVTLRAE